jgi:hypothetical protein
METSLKHSKNAKVISAVKSHNWLFASRSLSRFPSLTAPFIYIFSPFAGTPWVVVGEMKASRAAFKNNKNTRKIESYDERQRRQQAMYTVSTHTKVMRDALTKWKENECAHKIIQLGKISVVEIK